MSLRWLVWLGAALLALTLFGLLLDVPVVEGDGRALVTILLGLVVLAAAVYFAAVRLILRYAWPRCADRRDDSTTMIGRSNPLLCRSWGEFPPSG